MLNYLSKFSPRLAQLLGPIYAMMGKRSEWAWGPDQEAAFQEVKSEMCSDRVLAIFDPKARHVVSADAKQGALGAVLLQKTPEGWQLVEFASRRLTDMENRYAMIEKEALALTWACAKFDYYLVRRDFHLEIDHKPLVPLLGDKDLVALPPEGTAA